MHDKIKTKTKKETKRRKKITQPTKPKPTESYDRCIKRMQNEEANDFVVGLVVAAVAILHNRTNTRKRVSIKIVKCVICMKFSFVGDNNNNSKYQCNYSYVK